MYRNDTICALSTPSGPGGIAVIRLSGPDAKKIYGKVFKPASGKPPEERKLAFGKIYDGDSAVDEAMSVYFNSPVSYTGEDMAEFHCHGGVMPVKRVLGLLIKSGAALAEPGEFTKRAFINGKMDLSKAEAVMSYISSISEAGAKAAFSQLKGGLNEKISSLQGVLTDAIANIEAVIEYPEEDIEIEQHLLDGIKQCRNEIYALAKTFEEGRILTQGFNAAIAGKPNVGKSSLLNRLLGREKAIVTEIPGTTRDVIDDIVSIKGMPVRFFDTAGIRKTADMVENIGVNRAYEAMENADMILLVIDLSEGVSKEDLDIYETFKNKNIVIVLNKTDIKNKLPDEKVLLAFDGKKILYVSAITGEGMQALTDEVYNASILDETLLEGVIITSERHRNILLSAAKHLAEAVEAYKNGITIDCVSIDIKAAWNDLGKITGETATEDIIDKIFSKFCLGK